MSSRKQISAIDAVMSLVHDIQLVKNENKITSVLFMDVKGVYDHVSCNQLLKICKNLGLSRSLCSWIECFMNNRYVQLAFDESKQEKTRVEIGISQRSSISSILFLIYIRDIFSEINSMQIRSPSYVDDIELVASSETIEKNCLMLENAAEKLLQLQNQNNIQFDMKKIELIHFHSKRSIDNNNFPVSIRNNQKFLLEKYQKLQNSALKKILEVFKISFYMTMKLEAAIISSKARFDRICKNYALRIMQISKNHPIRLRVSTSFSSYNNEAELDWNKYLDWNEKNQAIETEIAEISSNSSSEFEQRQKHRKKRRKIKRKSKKKVSQLFKITSKIAELLSSFKTERIKQK